MTNSEAANENYRGTKKWRSNISSAHVRKFDSATSFRFATNATFQSAQNIRRLFRLPNEKKNHNKR